MRAVDAFGTPAPRVAIPTALSDEAALLAHLRLGPAELRKIWFYRDRMYHHFAIQKAGGKTRLISAPDVRLKMLQRMIADLLAPMYRARHPVHGFVNDRSIKSNAEAHLNRRFLLNLDLKDFFPSITEARVAGLMRAFGVDHRVADVVARLCCVSGHLPQGAPSGPVISNMICFRLDKALMKIARDARCIYTRYADDITLSGHQPPTALFEAGLPAAGPIAPEVLAPALRDAIGKNGFSIHPEKAHYADRNSRRIITGIKVNEFLNVDRRYVRNLRAALHSVETLGSAAAQKKFHDEYGGRSNLAVHLQGRVSFLRFIKGRADPVVRAITLRFNAAYPSCALKVAPTAAEARDRAVWVVDNDVDIEQGSAFFLAGVGLVTAAHCVKNATEVEIHHPSKPANRFKARVARSCPARDLALLEQDLPTTEFYKLEGTGHAIGQGDHVVAVGYPGFGPGDKVNARAGTVSSLPVKGGVQMVEVTQTLTPGMSGGPLLHDNAVAGIIHKGGSGEGRNFAVHIEMLKVWLQEEEQA